MDVTDPGYIGRVRIRNRIVMAPMISNLGQASGYTSEEHIAYLEERAKGGTGLIITEYTYVNSINSRGSRNQLGAFSMNMSPKLKRITYQLVYLGEKPPLVSPPALLEGREENLLLNLHMAFL